MATIENGCGPKPDTSLTHFLNKAIPEGLAPNLGGYNFTPSCNTHDICYSTPNSNKLRCDQSFHSNLKSQCRHWLSQRFSPHSSFQSPLKHLFSLSCQLNSSLYYLAVKALGQSAFNKAQSPIPD